TATGYVGTVHFTSSDGSAVLPVDSAFVATNAGVKTFSAALRTVGTQSITGTDTVNGSVTGSQSGILVNPAAAATILVSGYPTTTTAGVTNSFTLTMRDPFSNTATGYVGTVHFSSTDAGAVLPVNYAFTSGDAGVKSFSPAF